MTETSGYARLLESNALWSSAAILSSARYAATAACWYAGAALMVLKPPPDVMRAPDAVDATTSTPPALSCVPPTDST